MHGERGRRTAGALAGGPRAGRCWQSTPRNGYGVRCPGFVCMWFAPPCPPGSPPLKCSGAGSVASRRGRGAQAFQPPSCRLQAQIQTRPPREAAGEGARGRPGVRGTGVRGPGAWWRRGSGVCPAGWKAEGEVSSGVGGGVGGGRKKANPPPPPSLSALCVSVQPVHLGRPPLQPGGRGRGRAGGGGAGGVRLRPFLSLSYLERTISKSVSSVSDLWHSKPDYSSH